MAKPVNKEEGRWYFWNTENPALWGKFEQYAKKMMKRARRKYDKNIIKEEIENGKPE